MVNTEKIRLMAQAAAYEKKFLPRDAFARRYYKEDYVDRERLRARIFATLFFILFWGYQAVKIFYIEGVNFLTYNYVGLMIRIIVEYVLLLVGVSLVAGLVHALRFDKAKARLDSYYDLLDQIDSYQ
ncbi:MAG: hypothetical protein HUJ69_07845 [Lachnospiraceae bacterium]|nr:hypothetical protein [Lachnospiraceae bacterium]